MTKFNPDTLDQIRIRELQEALPETRWNLGVNHRVGDAWNFLARLSYYDGWFDSEDSESYDGEYLVDVEGSYTWNQHITFTVGGQNVFNTYPDENPNAAAGVGNRYSQFTPFGFNGGFWYARMGFRF